MDLDCEREDVEKRDKENGKQSIREGMPSMWAEEEVLKLVCKTEWREREWYGERKREQKRASTKKSLTRMDIFVAWWASRRLAYRTMAWAQNPGHYRYHHLLDMYRPFCGEGRLQSSIVVWLDLVN